MINYLGRLAKCCKPCEPRLCKILRAWVKCQTEQTVFLCKLKILSHICIFLWVRALGTSEQQYFVGIFVELLFYFRVVDRDASQDHLEVCPGYRDLWLGLGPMSLLTRGRLSVKVQHKGKKAL